MVVLTTYMIWKMKIIKYFQYLVHVPYNYYSDHIWWSSDILKLGQSSTQHVSKTSTELLALDNTLPISFSILYLSSTKLVLKPPSVTYKKKKNRFIIPSIYRFIYWATTLAWVPSTRYRRSWGQFGIPGTCEESVISASVLFPQWEGISDRYLY